MAKLIRNGVVYGGGGYTKSQIDQKLSEINTKIIGIDSSAADYIELANGKRIYLTDTIPTGNDIPDGSVWLGGNT